MYDIDTHRGRLNERHAEKDRLPVRYRERKRLRMRQRERQTECKT